MSPKPCAALLIVLSIATGSLVSAQGRSVTNDYAQSVLRATATHINGRLEPNRVPLSLRMKLFFYRYRRAEGAGYYLELSKVLSIADQQVLDDYARLHTQAVENDAREFAASADNIVMRSMGLSAIEIAEQFQAAYDERQSKALSRYEDVLGKLSPDGRAVVERFAYERVRPSFTRSMPIDVAKMAPAMFLSDVATRREEILKGEQDTPTAYPDSVQEQPSLQGEGAALSVPQIP